MQLQAAPLVHGLRRSRPSTPHRVGVFVDLIARGHKMSEHALEAAQVLSSAQRANIQQVANSGSSTADELEFASAKAKVLGS
jgi:hypothetical protein